MKKSVNSGATNIKPRRRIKNRLDEMQEQKLLKIEHNGCWLAFWGLFAAFTIQLLIYGYGDVWKYVAGEWIVFMCLALYIGIACIRNGIWDRKLAATPIVNLCASLIAGITVCVINSVISYKRYASLSGAVATGIVSGIFCFAVCFGVMTLATFLYKKRLNALESEDTDDK